MIPLKDVFLNKVVVKGRQVSPRDVSQSSSAIRRSIVGINPVYGRVGFYRILWIVSDMQTAIGQMEFYFHLSFFVAPGKGVVPMGT